MIGALGLPPNFVLMRQYESSSNASVDRRTQICKYSLLSKPVAINFSYVASITMTEISDNVYARTDSTISSDKLSTTNMRKVLYIQSVRESNVVSGYYILEKDVRLETTD